MSKTGNWVANLSDGSTHVQRDTGDVSSWRQLMLYCAANRCYITNLRMTVGTQTVSCPPNAMGYWHANAMPSVQGVPCDDELHEWHGIGWVDAMSLQVKVIWGALDPRTHQVVFWQDVRDAETQGQIIWSKPTFTLKRDPEEPLKKDENPVRGVKEMSRRIADGAVN